LLLPCICISAQSLSLRNKSSPICNRLDFSKAFPDSLNLTKGLRYQQERGLFAYRSRIDDGADDWHANALSGYAGALMVYCAFYGASPINTTVTNNKLKTGYFISGTSINPYFSSMYGTDAVKDAKLETIASLAAQYVISAGCYLI